MYCAPYTVQARAIAWDYLTKYSEAIPGHEIHKQSLAVDYPNGGRIMLAGADNVDRHRGIYLDHLVLDEYPQMSSRIWSQVFRPALADRKGSANIMGTPMGRGNDFYDLFTRAKAGLEDWSTHLYTVADTGLIDPKELEAARREMSPEEFEQEFMCSFDAAIKGAYWSREMAEAQEQGRITSVPYQDQIAVHTVWDLGMADSTAIWFLQFAGQEVHFIDYKEFTGMGFPAIVRELNKLPYIYGDHVAPHDIRVRELGSGATRLETARSLGINFKICKNIDLMDGIDAVRSLLKRSWFDKVKCAPGLECLRSYRSQYDDVHRVFSNRPLHDWTSHGADAMRYTAVHFGKGQQQPPPLDYSRLNRRTV